MTIRATAGVTSLQPELLTLIGSLQYRVGSRSAVGRHQLKAALQLLRATRIEPFERSRPNHRAGSNVVHRLILPGR